MSNRTDEWAAVGFESLWCSYRRLPTDCCIDERPIWERDIDFCYEEQTSGSSSNFATLLLLSERHYHNNKAPTSLWTCINWSFCERCIIQCKHHLSQYQISNTNWSWRVRTVTLVQFGDHVLHICSNETCLISHPECVPLLQCDIIHLCSISQALISQARTLQPWKSLNSAFGPSIR